MRLFNSLSLALTLALAGNAQTAAPDPVPAVANQPGLYATFDTSLGQIVAELYEDKAPQTVKNFVALATGTKPSASKAGILGRTHYYDGLTFHRVIKGFMIQTGDTRGTGNTDCGVARLRDEIDASLKFDTVGRLAMANTGSPNTAACQFFITVSKPAYLNGSYTIFGQVVSGQDIATKISEVPTSREKPVVPVIVKKVTIERKK